VSICLDNNNSPARQSTTSDNAPELPILGTRPDPRAASDPRTRCRASPPPDPGRGGCLVSWATPRAVANDISR